jgi:hypothetical protein
MAGLDHVPGSPGGLSPERLPARGPSGWLALSLIAAALTAMVGISLLAGAGGERAGAQAVVGGNSSAARASVVIGPRATTGRPSATRGLTKPTDPEVGTPPPWVDVPVGPTRACPPDSTPDRAGPPDQDRPEADYPRMAFDRQSGRIILFVTGPEAWETWAFDVCANTWERMRPNRQPASGAGASGLIQLVYDADSDLTIGVFSDGMVWAFDYETDTWTKHGKAPDLEPLRLVYDPVSGLVVVQSIEGRVPRLWTYDVEIDTWTSISQAEAPSLGSNPDHGMLAYDGSVDRVIAYNGLSYGTRLLDLRTGTWSRSAAVTPVVNTGYFATGGEIAYDEAGEQTVVFSDGLVIAYHARSDRWEILDGQSWSSGETPTGPTARLGHWMVYDSSNARLVVYGAYRADTGWVRRDDLLAFDPDAREWTVLLEAGKLRRPLQ